MAAIWQDVLDTRARADEHAELVKEVCGNEHAHEEEGLEAAYAAFEAMRLEIRAAAQTISYALGDHAENLREIMRRG